MIQFVLGMAGAFWLLHKWTAPVVRPAATPKGTTQRVDVTEAEAKPDVQSASVGDDAELDVKKDTFVAPPLPEAPSRPSATAPLEVNPFRSGQKRQESPYGVRGSMDDILPTKELEGEEEPNQFAEEGGDDDEVEID